MTQFFRTLDEAKVAGKRVLLRVDLNVPLENGHIADVTRHRPHPADDPGNRRQARQGRPAVAFRPAERPRCRKFAARYRRCPRRSSRPTGKVRCRLPRRKSGGGDRANGRWRHRAAGKHPLPSGRRSQRSGLRRRTRQIRRPLCQRCFLGGPSRACLDRRPRSSSAGLCRTQHASRTRGACASLGKSAAAGGGHRRRRQDLDQARPSLQTSCARSIF